MVEKRLLASIDHHRVLSFASITVANRLKSDAKGALLYTVMQQLFCNSGI